MYDLSRGMKRSYIPLLLLLAIVGSSAAYVYFSVKMTVEVFGANVDVSPKSFSISVAKGGYYVREITVTNYGGEKEIYFEGVVEGPDSDAIDISFHRKDGSKISSRSKLTVPAANQTPAEIKVNVHIKVKDDAVNGSYVVYVVAKGLSR